CPRAWTLAAIGGTNVCLRRVDADSIFDAIEREHVTHLCGAPIVMGMMVNSARAADVSFGHPVQMMTAGAAPPADILKSMAHLGVDVTHAYGLTEVYGPCTTCEPQPAWADRDDDERARLKARQGVAYATQEAFFVAHPETLSPLPHDGETMGELMFRGNTTMKGYLKNPAATEAAFKGGMFHTGDLGVTHPDGYIEIRDRSKDIIISGGENISSIEVENALYRHPAVGGAAVVARPDERWGETPCAFVELREGASAHEAELIAHCRAELAGYKCPKTVVFGELPKTSTGKIQKFVLRERAAALN
ncbi:MAG: AMP-binding protein, partial [Pseudomonadota bacterium]